MPPQRTVIVTSDPEAKWVKDTTQRMARGDSAAGEVYVIDSSQPGAGGEGVGPVLEAVGGGGGGGQSEPVRETITAAVIGGIGSALGGALIEAALDE
jgi:hypothetical protein